MIEKSYTLRTDEPTQIKKEFRFQNNFYGFIYGLISLFVLSYC